MACLLTLLACKDGFYFNSDSKDAVVAKVGERSLLKSEMDELLHSGVSPTDSAAIVDGFTINWIRERLMISEAEKYVAADININQLVDDYRSSLLVYNYEKRIVDEQLDTIISVQEMTDYYNLHKNQYLLSHPIAKCIIAKIPENNADIKILASALKKSDLTEAIFLIKEHAVYHQLDTSQFMTLEDIRSILPKEISDIDRWKSNNMYTEKIKGYQYFVKIIKIYDENTIPPFEYIKVKINKTILSERKIQLLKSFRDHLYEKGLKNKEFEIFNQD